MMSFCKQNSEKLTSDVLRLFSNTCVQIICTTEAIYVILGDTNLKTWMTVLPDGC